MVESNQQQNNIIVKEDMLKKDYSRDIKLRCVVCGDTDSFKVDDNDQTIICEKCGREYLGGEDELVELNQQLIDEEVEDIKAEVTKDVQKEFNKMIKSIFK